MSKNKFQQDIIDRATCSRDKAILQSSNIKLFILLTIFVLVSLPTKAISAFDKDKINILVLLSYEVSLPWTQSFIGGLEEARKFYNNRVNYYIEIMDSVRLESMSEEKWAVYLEDKYQSTYFDGVIADSDYASHFVSNNKIIFPEKIPIVYYTDIDIEYSMHSIALVSQINKSVQNTFKMALHHNPQANHIFVIDNQDNSHLIADKITTLANETGLNLRITILNSFSLDTLSKELMSLPPNSIVFYTLVFQDSTGENFIPKDFISEISSISTAPIYSFWSSLMGSGVVGGEMIDGEKTAIQMVNAIIDYLESGKSKNEYSMMATFIDWEALIKYHIDPDLIPKDAIIINRPVSIFQTYFREILLLMLTLFSTTVGYGFYKLLRLNNKLVIANDEAERLARIDTLTNLYNRRAFFEKGYEAYNLTKRLGKQLSVLMIDIDFFKNVNDKFGHSTGDKVIKVLGNIIKRVTREVDISARIGGEEFAVIVMFSDASDAAKLAYRILKEVSSTFVIADDAKSQIHFTVSIGVFGEVFVLKESSLEDALKYADEALYQAKERGRDQVVVYEEDNLMATLNDS
jgi:diguanylate cyclase (GGDEF)-like protein